MCKGNKKKRKNRDRHEPLIMTYVFFSPLKKKAVAFSKGAKQAFFL